MATALGVCVACHRHRKARTRGCVGAFSDARSMCEIVAPLRRMEFTLWRFYIQKENKSARKCHRREDAHRVAGWECANSGLVCLLWGSICLLGKDLCLLWGWICLRWRLFGLLWAWICLRW